MAQPVAQLSFVCAPLSRALSHLRRRPPSPPRFLCSASRRRKNVGVPKNVQIDPPAPQLTADQSPWEDFLVPHLAGNSRPAFPARYDRSAPPFLVLGVESSCDDTAAAVVRSDGTVLAERAVSQHALTEQWGGVVPHVARDAHERAIADVIDGALADAGLHAHELHAVAATMGPGLEVCLRVGYRAARDVARAHALDFVAVNHLEAHLLVARLPRPSAATTCPPPCGGDGDASAVQSLAQGAEQDPEMPRFPFLTLLVSGGHCQLLLVRGVADYAVLGGTLDDALGEAYDKTARLLGLRVGGGGGPALEKLATRGNPSAIPFPVPMAKRPDCNFSFAGLKTSVRTAIDRLGGDEAVRASDALTADVAASFQETAVRHLEQRVTRAIAVCAAAHPGEMDTLVVSGGVAANRVIRARLQGVCEKAGWNCVVPPVQLCTDNGVMVAWAGVERLRKGIADDTQNLDVRARWPLAGLDRLAMPVPPDVSLKEGA